MDDAKVVETFKSAAQCTRYAGEIALQIVKLIDGQADNSLIQSLISSPDSEQGQETKQIIEEVVTRILQIKTDLWKREKEKIEKFYVKHFGIKSIDWSKSPIPASDIPGMKIPEFRPASITEDKIFEAYKKEFGEDKVYKAYNSITKAIKVQQDRPKGDYCFLHKGGAEPDAEHFNDSYDMFSVDGNKYMVPIEGMIAAFRYRTETGNMYDVKGLTRFHALDSGGYAMFMCRRGLGKFRIDRGYRGYQDPDGGPRQVSF